MTPKRRGELERLVRRLETCPPPHRVDLHREAADAIREWLAEDEHRQVRLWDGIPRGQSPAGRPVPR